MRKTSVMGKSLLRRYNQTLPFEIVHVFDAAGQLVFKEGEGTLPVDQQVLTELQQGREVMRSIQGRHIVGISYFDAENQKKYLVVASSIDVNSHQQLLELRLILFIGCLVAAVIVLGAGRLFAQQALRPITKVVQEVENISASDLHLRLTDADGKDELSHLAHTFNNMLDRLEQAFAIALVALPSYADKILLLHP